MKLLPLEHILRARGHDHSDGHWGLFRGAENMGQFGDYETKFPDYHYLIM